MNSYVTVGFLECVHFNRQFYRGSLGPVHDIYHPCIVSFRFHFLASMLHVGRLGKKLKKTFAVTF